MLEIKVKNVFRKTHCPRKTSGLAHSSVVNRCSNGAAATSSFQFIVLPGQKSNTGESCQPAIIAALVNGSVMPREGGSRSVLAPKRSSLTKTVKVSRPPENLPIVELTKHAPGYWSVSSNSRRKNDAGGKCSGMSCSWHAGIETRVKELCRLNESTGKESTISKRSPSLMTVFQACDCKAPATKSTGTAKNNYTPYGKLGTILLMLEDKSIKLKSTPERFRDKINTVLSSLVVTYEMEKPSHQGHARNAAKHPHFENEAESKCEPYPGAYEFAKARGYDFLLLKDNRLENHGDYKQHPRKSSRRILYKKMSTEKNQLVPCGPKFAPRTTEGKNRNCEDVKRLRNEHRPHGLNSYIKDAEFLESAKKDVERAMKVSRKLGKLGVAITGAEKHSGKSAEITEGDVEVKDRLCAKVEALVLNVQFDDYKEHLRKMGTLGERQNRAMEDSEKDFRIAGGFHGPEDSESSTVISILPRLSDKTSKLYKLCNSLSATIFRETQLVMNPHAHKLNQRKSSKEQHLEICREINHEDDRANPTFLKKNSFQSPVNYSNGDIDHVRLEEKFPFENHVSALKEDLASSRRDYHDSGTDDAACVQQPCAIDESLVYDNCNNNALPVMQLSLDDLCNDFSYSEDDGDTSWEPRRPREPSTSSCHVNEDAYTSSKQNTANRGVLRLPLLLNNSNRRLTARNTPSEIASPIPPIASQKSSEDYCATKNVKQCRKVKKKEAEPAPYLYDLHKERVSIGDLKSVRRKRQPTRLSPVVYKQSSNVFDNINAQGDTQNEDQNLANAESKLSANTVFSTPKTSGLLSPCLAEDRRNALGLQQSICQNALGDRTVSPHLVIPKQSTFMRSPDFAVLRSNPEHSVASALARETRCLPNLIQSECVLRNPNINRGCNSKSKSTPNINNSNSLNTNNSSTKNHPSGSCVKGKAISSQCTDCRSKLNHNYNAVPDCGKSSRRRVTSSRGLSVYQNKFIDDLGSELKSLIEYYQRRHASDINTSNTTRGKGHYRELASENAGRAIRFGNLRQTKSTRQLCSGNYFETSQPESNPVRDYKLWSTNDPNMQSFPFPGVPGSDNHPDQKHSESEIVRQSTYAPNTQCPVKEKYCEDADHDHQVHFFNRQLPFEENFSDNDVAMANFGKKYKNSVFAGCFHQGETGESMEVEETATDGARYDADLLAICRKLDERLQISQVQLSRAIQSMNHSFGHKLKSLRSLVKGKSAYNVSNDVAKQEDNACCSQQENNETIAMQSQTNTMASADAHVSSVSETRSSAVRGILRNKAASDKTKQKNVTRKKVVILIDTSLKSAGSSSVIRSASFDGNKHIRGITSDRNITTTSKKLRRPRKVNQVYKSVYLWKEQANRPLNTHPRSKSKKAATSYHSNQHSRTCRRRHATDGTCCNLCLQKAVAALTNRPSSHARKKNRLREMEKTASGTKRKSAGFAKTSCQASKKSMDVSSKSRIQRRKQVARKTYRSRNRNCNNAIDGDVDAHSSATRDLNCNQNSRQGKRKKKTISPRVTRRPKSTRSKISYVITSKGQQTIYANLQKRYQHLLQYMYDLSSNANDCGSSKESDEYVQNLAMRFKNLVMNFPKHKLLTLEDIFKRYQEMAERHVDTDPDSSTSSLDNYQKSKAKNRTPRSLKRKKPVEEPHASNARENVYTKTRRNQSYNSKNVKDEVPWRSTNKRIKPLRAVDSLILTRQRLVERRNKSKNACLQTSNMAPPTTGVFQLAAQVQSFDFSVKSSSDRSTDNPGLKSGMTSSCSSCENMINACFFHPMYLLQGSSPYVSSTDKLNSVTASREAQRQNLFMQEATALFGRQSSTSNNHSTSKRPFLNDTFSNVLHPTLNKSLPLATTLPARPYKRSNNCFQYAHSSQKDTSTSLFPTQLLRDDFQQYRQKGMLVNTPLKQHENVQPKNNHVFGQLWQNRRQHNVLLQPDRDQNNAVCVNDEALPTLLQQSFFPKTLTENSTKPCPNKSTHSASNQDTLLVLPENTGKENEKFGKKVLKAAGKSKHSSSLWEGFEAAQVGESCIKKPHLCDSDKIQRESSSTNNTSPQTESHANNNINNEPPRNNSPLQNISSELPPESLTAGTQRVPLFIIRTGDEHTQEVCLQEKNPSTSSEAQPDPKDKTNNSMECCLEPLTAHGKLKKELQKSQKPYVEPFWERVQPYLIVDPPGKSTTWTCYYESHQNNPVVSNNAAHVSHTLSPKEIFAGTTTDQKHECASQHLIAETKESTECCQDNEEITTRQRSGSFEDTFSTAQHAGTENAPEMSMGENANDNARKLGMSWSANTTREFGSLIGETRSLRIDDFLNTGSTSASACGATGQCANSMVIFPGTACVSHTEPCFSHAGAKSIDSRETTEENPTLCRGAFANNCFAGLASSKGGSDMNSWPTLNMDSVGQLNVTSGSCSCQRPSRKTLDSCREEGMEVAENSKKYDISNRKRRAKAPLSNSFVPPCKIPKLESQSCSDEIFQRHRVRYLRRSRFQLIRELRYLNKWQEAMDKLSRYQESHRLESMIKLYRATKYDEASDADSESSL